jgi:threonine synthase
LDHAVDQLQNLCGECGKPLLAGYDLASLRETFTPTAVRQRTTRSMWRFADVLPVEDVGDAVSLGEGETPLLRLERRGAFAEFENLFVKDEAFNPTGSFKARGMSAAVTRAVALGAKVIALPSAGNAAGAATYYANRAGIECFLFMPEDTPPANIIESVVGGANVFLVNGLISDCGKLVKRGCEQFGWFDLSTLKEPYRVEGKKTMGYELAEQLGGRLPDAIVYPTGGGTGLIGMWKAFDEMERLGWIGSDRPKMFTVQATGCAPMVRAWEAGKDHADTWEGATTYASGLRVPGAVGDFLILRALRESGGGAVAVADHVMAEWVAKLGADTGIFAAPEGGATAAAVPMLIERGLIAPDDEVVLFNTGSGLKYVGMTPID